jgi:signal recognition particle subunit SRP68
LEDARKKSTDVVEEISWQGQTVSVKGQRLRLALVKAKDAQLELSQIDPSKIERKNEVFDKLFATFNDAMQAAKEDSAPAAGAASQKTEQQKKTATLLLDYIAYQRLMTTTDRSLMLAEALEARFDGLSPEADLSALQDDARQLVGFYLALQYAGDKKAAEALALLERCGEHAEAALAHHNICKNQNKSLISKVEKLQRDVRGWRCYLQARAFMASSNLASSGEISASTLAPGGLLANLDKYDASYLDEKLIVEFPPGFEAIACKPVLFDLALSAFQPPDLSEKKKAPKGGFFSSFWG